MGQVFVDVCVKYLTFKICYIRFLDQLWIEEHFTHNNEQFEGCLIKIKQILNILQGF